MCRIYRRRFANCLSPGGRCIGREGLHDQLGSQAGCQPWAHHHWGQMHDHPHGCIIVSHDRAKKRINPQDKGQGAVRLGNDVFVGVNSVILRDVTIGEYSIIGAGSTHW